MTRRKGGRPINAHERKLWDQVVRNATPMARPKTISPIDPPELPEPLAPKENEHLPEGFRIGLHARQTSPPGRTSPAPAGDRAEGPLRMDQKSFGRLKRGKLKPEARLDLHGMTLDAAHGALTRFILTSSAQGRRLVLVITGKGKPGEDQGPIPVRVGVLRHHAPRWLASGPLAQAVLQVVPAHHRHGGEGAFYVYLRRRR